MHDARTGMHTITRIEEAAGPASAAQKVTAYYLLDDLMATAARHGLQLSDFDPFVDLPAACLKVAAAPDAAK
ncbi:hypothetical protein [Streptomyces sp. AM6-12]|uniref:hypothetical protein n=1 Tax=Streptomyces sp. AM6-12 TaxID=3345149 RepID=UPI0037AD583F